MQLLVGPFKQIVTMDKLVMNGPLADTQLEIIENGAILLENGKIVEVGSYDKFPKDINTFHIEYPAVCLPGFIDAHTHICYAGNRAHEYAMKLQGLSYQEIAKSGGGILSTVTSTRKASADELFEGLCQKADALLGRGVTTCEVKSGYGLNVEDELKILRVIKKAAGVHPLSLVPTCLAAHVVPKEFDNPQLYLNFLCEKLLPIVVKEKLAKRVDIFVEKGAFSVSDARAYLTKAKQMGFDLVIHGDQFSAGGAALAAELKAISVDHLEHVSEADAHLLAKARIIPVVLPGASFGLGEKLAPARMLLDLNLSLVIASDWNPGSAPMGDLLTQSALLGIHEKITMAETFAAITFRAAKALGLSDRGILKSGMLGDFSVFSTENYHNILYEQGALKPQQVFKEGKLC